MSLPISSAEPEVSCTAIKHRRGDGTTCFSADVGHGGCPNRRPPMEVERVPELTGFNKRHTVADMKLVENASKLRIAQT
jgi:hypothetical protein